MRVKYTNIVDEIEQCKDILWFLNGYIASSDESCITNEHIEALKKLIIFSQSQFENTITNAKGKNQDV